MPERPTFSVCIPCYNEEENVVAMAEAVIAQLEPIGEPFDILFIDNASADRTVALVREMAARDPRIRLIVNIRNFGQMRSPTHAIFQARGKAIIAMCCDFQDPPELIPQFVTRWRAGTDIVLGVRYSEKSGVILGGARGLAYAFLGAFADYPVIRDATGFGLYDAKVVRAIAALNEPEPFFRGLLVETGYSVETITYPRPKRQRGKSSNNFWTLLDFALSGLAGSTKKIVRLPMFVGLAGFALTILSWLIAIATIFTGGPTINWLIAGVFELQFGLLFIFLGVMGDQIRLISERTRGTPLVIERERVNFPEDY